MMPKMPPEAYKTYKVLRPRSTHTRVATCAEVECGAYLRGWVTKLDLSTDLGKRQARYIREHAGRAYATISVAPLLVLDFPAGQQCFAEHRVAVERMPIFQVAGGDFRGNPRGTPTVTRTPQDWLDDFGSHQITLAEALRRG